MSATFRGPRTGADRAVLLAHGAGADRNAPALIAVADALASAGVPSLRFDYPYRAAGRRAPDRPVVLDAATRDAAASLARRTGLPPERIVLGGRSMGGRYCSLVVGSADDPLPALGLLLLGYPLHAMGKPERRRDEHFKRLSVPVLFVSGTRDSMAPRAELTRSARKIKGTVTKHWLDTADHGFRPLKRSGLTADAVLADVAETSVTWVAGLA
ncbi:MAG TPA: alpha/beta family hydrolase [Acidimicrobiia bacterium]|nr:alpha/beta family hydrolase [Acidimicrobiia bacterium]